MAKQLVEKLWRELNSVVYRKNLETLLGAE